MLMFAAVSVFIFRVTTVAYAVKTALKFTKRYVSFHDAAYYEIVFSNIIAASITMFVLKTFNLLYLSKRALLQTSTLKRNMIYIIFYAACIVYTVILVVVGMTSVYGASCRHYCSLSTSLMNTINILLLKSNLQNMGCVMEPASTDLVFHSAVVFVLLSWMLLLIFALIKITSLSALHDSHFAEKTEFIDFVFSRLLLMLGFWNMTQYSEHMMSTKH